MLVQKFGKGLVAQHAVSKESLGGKGAHLVEMAELGLPVPHGFIIPTDLSRRYLAGEDIATPLRDAIAEGTQLLRVNENGLDVMPLVSVRSGAPVSMPGMMDTILNVGLTADTYGYWVGRFTGPVVADCHDRLLRMFADVVHGVTLPPVECSGGTEEISNALYASYENLTQTTFPSTVEDQIYEAAYSVIKSWDNERARYYRKINHIDDTLGTAVVVQAMVFGNSLGNSCSGVIFTRNPNVGEPGMFGEYVLNAQGEELVAGTVTPRPISELGDEWSGEGQRVYDELRAVGDLLEAHYHDMQDIEFTVENGTVYILQCRSGKRTAIAAVKIALDLVNENVITPSQVRDVLTMNDLHDSVLPTVGDTDIAPTFTGCPASIGAARGKPVYTSQEAVEARAEGIDTILCVKETSPEDLMGMQAAVGVVTVTGGATSHAAVVARSMNKPCVVGVKDLFVDGPLGTEAVIDGGSGGVWIGDEAALIPFISGSNATVRNAILTVLYNEHGLHRYTTDSTGFESIPNTPVYIAASAWSGGAGDLASFRKNYTGFKSVLVTGGVPRGSILDLTIRPEDAESGWDIFGSSHVAMIRRQLTSVFTKVIADIDGLVAKALIDKEVTVVVPLDALSSDAAGIAKAHGLVVSVHMEDDATLESVLTATEQGMGVHLSDEFVARHIGAGAVSLVAGIVSEKGGRLLERPATEEDILRRGDS